MAWSASDKVALVAEPGLFSVAGTERTMRAIQLFRQEFAPNLSPAGIVANRVRTGSAEHTYRLAEMESMFGELLLTPHIPEQANWQQIQGAAHSIHHWPGDSAKNAAALFDALLANLLAAGPAVSRGPGPQPPQPGQPQPVRNASNSRGRPSLGRAASVVLCSARQWTGGCA